MKRIIGLIIVGFFISMSWANAQLEEVKLLMRYNCETNLYDVFFKVDKGSAVSTLERVQFNSQLSVVVPTGQPFVIQEFFNPIVDNQTGTGTTPMTWTVNLPIISPPGCEGFDFYSIIPNLTPASFYNEVAEGDKVKIFSFAVGEETEYNEDVRFFDNIEDPAKSNFEGADLRNGIAIGSAMDIYKGNIHQDCTTSTDSKKKIDDIILFPNPTADMLYIKSEINLSNITIIDPSGRKIYANASPQKGLTSISVQEFLAGNYIVVLSSPEHTTKRMITIQR